MLRESHIYGGRDGYEKPLLASGDEAARRGHPEVLKRSRRVVKAIQFLIDSFPEKIAPGAMAMRSVCLKNSPVSLAKTMHAASPESSAASKNTAIHRPQRCPSAGPCGGCC